MKLLLIDSNSEFIDSIQSGKTLDKHVVYTAESYERANSLLEEKAIDAIFLNIDFQEGISSKIIEKAVQSEPETLVVILSVDKSHSDDSILDYLSKGAFLFLDKSDWDRSIDKVLNRLTRLIGREGRKDPVKDSQNRGEPIIIYESREPKVEKVYKMAEKAGRTQANIILLGPSGTGKTLFAKHIHSVSSRREKPFVVVHCPSLSSELLESELFGHVKGAFTGAHKDTWGRVHQANNGTLFLDEISDLTPAIQAKLLRLLQSGDYERVGESVTRHADVRILAATNHNLYEDVQKGKFREDLYYRLNVVTLELPSLAERKADIVPVAKKYLEYFNHQNGEDKEMTEDYQNLLLRYPWPGNFRELRNIVERSIIFSEGNFLDLSTLPANFRESQDQDTRIQTGQPVSLQELEEEHIRQVLEREPTIKDAAEVLGIDTATLYRKRKRMEAEQNPETQDRARRPARRD